ncbi:MAG: 4-hydroxybenzoate octaprenyltransferase [Magnetococcales bacterium]|nr:4-hydroxybenzoate octaprenyltransferase [Magnetococcales bacterium]
MTHWIDHLPAPLLRESLRLMRVDRPIGTWLVLWPCLWALFAAAKPNYPDAPLLIIFIMGSFLMRSAGCVINDLADKDFDPQVARTRERPLAARRISTRAAKGLLLLLLAAALLLALQLNKLAIQLSVVGALLAVSYPFTKRFVHWPQFYLGAAFGWGVIMAWGAATETVPWPAWLYFAATLTWAAAYDTLYALMDIEDDLQIGVKSTAILFGRWAVPIVALLYLLTLTLLAAAGWWVGLSLPYYCALLLGLAQMGWQITMARQGSYLAAFLSNKWFGAVILLGILLA